MVRAVDIIDYRGAVLAGAVAVGASAAFEPEVAQFVEDVTSSLDGFDLRAEAACGCLYLLAQRLMLAPARRRGARVEVDGGARPMPTFD